MKITLGDVTIVIEPGDDPSQVIQIANAIGRQKDSPFKGAAQEPVKSIAVGADSAPSRKSSPRCRGVKSCEGLYHYSDQSRQYTFMCDTYEYVASYKHGRVSSQAASVFGISTSAAYHRLQALVKLGLLSQEGRLYVASQA